MVVWDHLNPQLYCSCNWLVVPRTDLYDVLQFVCPTLKIAVKQLDGYSRPENEMNENIFRRRWRGSENDFKSSIQNGSIHSFCDVSSSESLKTCNNGRYDSAVVRIKHDQDKKQHYEKNAIYVFYNNGDDGKESTIRSKKVSCSMLFAVYVSDDESVEHDMTFGKKALTEECKCNQPHNCPTEATIKTTASTTSTTSTLTFLEHPLSVLPTVTASQVLSTQGSPIKNLHSPSKYSTTTILPTILIPTTPPDGDILTKRCWLTTGLLIIMIILTFVSGIVCTLLSVAVRKKTKKKYAECSRNIYAQCYEDKQNNRFAEIDETHL